VRSTTPPVKRVTRELLGQIATKIPASDSASWYSVTPRPWVQSAAESPDQPKPTEDAISPSAPYSLNRCSRTPIDSSPMLSTTYPFRATAPIHFHAGQPIYVRQPAVSASHSQFTLFEALTLRASAAERSYRGRRRGTRCRMRAGMMIMAFPAWQSYFSIAAIGSLYVAPSRALRAVCLRLCAINIVNGDPAR
jgi:hypothetical protein